MQGKGVGLTCRHCSKQYEMDEYGMLHAVKGETEFDFVTDWYAWERECVRQELANESYRLYVPVDICMSIDTKKIYRVGEGRLVHSNQGFHLTGCEGKLDYTQNPISSYSLYSDFNWYEVGDVICIGNHKALYYCFPKDDRVSVAKTRLAVEELYKLAKTESRAASSV